MNWEDITIKQYNGILSIISEGSEEIETSAKLYSLLNNTPLDEVYNLTTTEFSSKIKCLDFLGDKMKPRLPDGNKFEINGNKYTLTVNANKMTAGQYLDYNNVLKDAPDNFSMLCAILLIPEGKKYGSGYDVVELSVYLENNMKIVDALGVSFFLRLQYRSLIDAMIVCSGVKLKLKRVKVFLMAKLKKTIPNLKTNIIHGWQQSGT